MVVLGLASFACACDSGSDQTDGNRRTPKSAESPDTPVDVVEACRGVYERLPQAERDATTEEAFILECIDAIDGVPDPMATPLV